MMLADVMCDNACTGARTHGWRQRRVGSGAGHMVEARTCQRGWDAQVNGDSVCTKAGGRYSKWAGSM